MAFLRSPEAIRAYGIVPRRLVGAGHSMGGYMAAHGAASEASQAFAHPEEGPSLSRAGLEGPSPVRPERSRGTHPSEAEGPLSEPSQAPPRAGDSPLAGLILLDAWNIATDAVQVRAAGAAGRAGLIASLDDFGRALHGATPESVADEIIAAQGLHWSLPAIASRVRAPVLTITAIHRGAAENRVTTEAMRRAGVPVTAREIDSDHPFADHRIALEMAVVRWLGQIEGPRR